MGRAKGNLTKELATLRWPAGVVFGVGAFLATSTLLPMFVKEIPFRTPERLFRGTYGK